VLCYPVVSIIWGFKLLMITSHGNSLSVLAPKPPINLYASTRIEMYCHLACQFRRYSFDVIPATALVHYVCSQGVDPVPTVYDSDDDIIGDDAYPAAHVDAPPPVAMPPPVQPAVPVPVPAVPVPAAPDNMFGGMNLDEQGPMTICAYAVCCVHLVVPRCMGCAVQAASRQHMNCFSLALLYFSL
jgi:hypothetical protein